MASATPSKTGLQSLLVTLTRFASVFTTKRSLARLLSTFLCCVVIVVRPFSRLGGRYAFLVLALKELVFGVQASMAQQLELTVLNILGALLGIAVSTLAKFIASRYPDDSATARGTCAVFLVIISFFGESLPSSITLMSDLAPSSQLDFSKVVYPGCNCLHESPALYLYGF